MRKKLTVFMLILTAALLLCGTCSALSLTPVPTPTAVPTPTPLPTPTLRRWDSCGNHIRLSFRSPGPEPEQHLLYSHENGIMADGFLMFMPLAEYVAQQELPVISRSRFLEAEVTHDAYVDSLTVHTECYRKTGDGLELVPEGDPAGLPEGTYLVKIDCNAAHQGEAYRFFYLFWTE